MNSEKEVIIITGSSGYIGRAVARDLVKRYRVIGLDRDEPKTKIPNVDYRIFDISSPKNIEKVLMEIYEDYGQRIHSVVHLVAYYSFSGEESSKYQEITVNGTKSFMKCLNKFFTVEQFIFSSTMLVHESSPTGVETTEDSKVSPTWPYPASKVKAEEVIKEHHHDTPVVNLRIAGVYDDYGHSVPIGNHIARIYERHFSSMLFPGNIHHRQSYLHLNDLVKAVKLLIEKRFELPPHLVLLLGEDEAMSYKELQETLGRLIHNRPWPTFRIPEVVAKIGAFLQSKTPFMREPFIKPWMIEYADDQYDLNISQVRKFLNWEPQNKLRDVLPSMVKALKEDPDRWYQEHKMVKPRFRSIETSSYEEAIYRACAIGNIFLALWLFSNPFMVGGLTSYEFWNDVLVSILVMIVSIISFIPTMRWTRWINTLLASWLMFSPLVFWTDEATVYNNNTLFSALILLLAAYTPSRRPDEKEEIPDGWSYNPSSWKQRTPIMFLAFFGFLLAKYLAAYQLGHIPNAWDPFFGNGTETILKSDVSKAFPISDAGLGALSYLLDVIAATIGDKNRWRTMPWMVILFGFFILPTGVTSITLVMLQPIGVGAWCSICLFASIIMLIMVPPSVDEVCASVQYLRRSVKNGKPFWRTFWFGGDDEVTQPVPPEAITKPFPYHLALSSLLGAWLLFAPTVLGLENLPANNYYITGALIITFAVIAFSEMARIVRMINVALGAWLMLSAWLVGEMEILDQVHSVVVGLIFILLSLPRGGIKEHFGTLDKWVRWTPLDFMRWYQQH